jgi:hypothetical protein
MTLQRMMWLAAAGVAVASSCGNDHHAGEPAVEIDKAVEAADAAVARSSDFCVEYEGYVEYLDETGPVAAEESIEWYRRFDSPAELAGDVRTMISGLGTLAEGLAEDDPSRAEDLLRELQAASQRVVRYVESNCG